MPRKRITIRAVFFSIFLLLAHLMHANVGTETPQQPSDQGGISLTSTDITQIIVLGVTIFILFVVLYMLYALKVFMNELDHKKNGTRKPVLDLTNAVPIEREHEIMLHHDYDGIRELDNNLPPWWVYMFYATIVFSVFYIWYYHFGGSGKLQQGEYEVELAEAEVQMKLAASKVDENSVTLITDKARLLKGEEVYKSNCAACHGKMGEGKVGPNLTDEYWLHGGDIKSVFKTVKYGVPSKGMISWQAQLGPAQIQEVSSYLLSLKGTNPPNPKAPQGNKE